MQVEFVMLDPYLRTTLKHNDEVGGVARGHPSKGLKR